MSKLWDIEQYLQNKKVFENSWDGETAHMDSYMTVINFEKLEAALVKSPFSNDELLNAADEWQASSYLSPIHKLLSIYVKRKIKALTVV